MNNKDLKQKLQQVLDQAHQDHEKMQIKETKSGYNFACPHCGDSYTQLTKKRAHILTDKAEPYFFCHHECGPMSLEDFFRPFGITPPVEDVFTFFDKPVKIPQRFKYDPKEMALSEISRLAVPIETVERTFGLLRIDESTPCWDYICSRNLQDHVEYLRYWPRLDRLVILNTLHEPEAQRCWNETGYYIETRSNVIGFQARSLNGSDPKYLTYSLEKIRGESGLDYRVKAGCEDYVKSLSNTYYSTHADWTEQVLIVEGPIDALFVPNGIALTGSTKRHKGLDGNPNCLYLFDNDEAGKKKQFEKAQYCNKPGYNWVGLQKDIGGNVKDINDIINHCAETEQPIPQLKNYFI